MGKECELCSVGEHWFKVGVDMRDKQILWEAYKILRDVCEQDGQCTNCVLYESCKDLPRAPHQIIQDMHYDLYLKPLFGEKESEAWGASLDFFKKLWYNNYSKWERKKKILRVVLAGPTTRELARIFAPISPNKFWKRPPSSSLSTIFSRKGWFIALSWALTAGSRPAFSSTHIEIKSPDS